jgi:hypothetical protein
VDTSSYNYGRSSEADYGNYTDMMNNYRDLASGGGGQSGGGSGSGGGGFSGTYNPYLVSPERVSASQASAERANTERAAAAQKLGPLERVTASDPYKSYGGYQQFADTGGYSGQDISDMRARGMAPVRAAYDAAARNVGQQRSLQGGYSPNAIAAQVKMAREQGQSMADAATNVNAGIAQARNQGRLAGLGGMQGIEANRQNAQMQGDIFNAGQANQGQQFDITNEMNTNQFNAGQGNQVGMFNAGQGNDVSMFNAGQMNDVGKYNAGLNFQGQTYNADAQRAMQSQQNAAGEAGAARSAAANQFDTQTRLAALGGMQNLYGTTPGASQLFGNQAMGLVNSGAQQGVGMLNGMNQALNQPGQFEQTTDRIGAINNAVQNGAQAYNTIFNQPRQSPTQQRNANRSLGGG